MRRIQRVIALFCTAILLIGSLQMEASAAEKETIIELDATTSGYNSEPNDIIPYSTTFIDASVDVYYDTSGMHITIQTTMNNTASIVGSKDIKVQVKNGFSWTTVATSTGGELSGYSGCSVNLTYPYSEKGKTYRVCCTHYGNVDEYRELYQETSGFLCNVTSTAP